MSRVVFPPGKQAEFIVQFSQATGFSNSKIASFCGVSRWTIRDWLNEKYLIELGAVERLCAYLGRPFPQEADILMESSHVQRAGRQGCICRNRIYGNPGTLEGRRKGGRASAILRKLHPERWANSGFITRKRIVFPEQTEDLAEAIGILLGDGCLMPYQVRVSLGALSDAQYAVYVKRLFEFLFGVEVVKRLSRKNTLDLVISSRALVEFLVKQGLMIGDKVAQQVDVPDWIKTKSDFWRACVRGLFDTDGSVYHHHHVCDGHKYINLAAVFTNHSQPLLKSFYGYLASGGYAAKYDGKRGVGLYREAEVERYFSEIGSHNPKHVLRFKRFYEAKRSVG